MFGNNSVLIIAEVSANHGRDFDRAIELIRQARISGADAVKFQLYRPDTLTINADTKYFQIEHPEWGGQTLYELYEKAYTPWEWFKDLKKAADDEGLIFLCSAFDKSSVDVLEDLGIVAHKIASFELLDTPLIEYAAKTGKPLILSTGMADVCDIHNAVNAARQAGAGEIVLLKCVSSYPAEPEEMNLKTIPHMKDLFGCDVGLSDHSLSIGASVCAAAMGAAVIEKHFTLSRDIKTPDSFFSIEPHELQSLVENVRIAEKALGRVHYGITEQEKKNRIFRRSLFVVKDVKAGAAFTHDNIRSIRPGYGISPGYLSMVLGMTAGKDIKKGTPLDWELLNCCR